MTFFSRTNRPPTVVPPIGDGTAPVYEEFFENGQYDLRETGKENLFDFVQASKEETLVYNIIERYRRGDLTALSQRVGQFIDVVGMPTNLAEAHQVMLDVQRKFETLAPDVKSKFDNDVNVFVDVVSHSTPDKLRELFGVTASDVKSVVKDGEVDVAE